MATSTEVKPKFTWKCKGFRISKAILKKNKFGGFILFYVKI
jgi:hypothetical protein